MKRKRSLFWHRVWHVTRFLALILVLPFGVLPMTKLRGEPPPIIELTPEPIEHFFDDRTMNE